MGHRALLAYRCDDADDSTDDDTDDDWTDDPDDSTADESDARYDLHRSHWGGANFVLLDHVSAESPFATGTAFAVDPEPVATDLALSEVVANHLDFLHHEAFYRVSPDYEPTAFHVVWFGLEIDSETVERSETVGHGALVEAHPDDTDYLRGWFRGTKAVVGAMHDRGALAREEAIEYLARRVETWADDREVILPE